MNGNREVNVRRGTGFLPDIRSSICSVFRFEDIGESRWLVHTEMYFDDGDEFHIVLRMTDGRYTLTDEGHTVMWLFHDGRDVPEDDRVVGQYGVSFDDGRLEVAVTSVRETGPALMSLLQAIMMVADTGPSVR